MAFRRAKTGYAQGLTAPLQSLGDCSAQNAQAAYVGVTLLDDGSGLFFAAGHHAAPGRKSQARFEYMGIWQTGRGHRRRKLADTGNRDKEATPLALLMKLSDLLAEFQNLRLDRLCNFEGAIGDSVAPAMADGRPARPLAKMPDPQLGSPPAVSLNPDKAAPDHRDDRCRRQRERRLAAKCLQKASRG